MQSVVDASGHSSMVELQPSKLAVRVRFPLPAPFFLLDSQLGRLVVYLHSTPP